MPDDKDRLGEKLREAERAREDQYFAQRDRELVEKMKQSKEADAEAQARAAAKARCPKCGEPLRPRTEHEITIDECPACGGVWFDKGEFEALAKRENEGWLARLWRPRTE